MAEPAQVAECASRRGCHRARRSRVRAPSLALALTLACACVPRVGGAPAYEPQDWQACGAHDVPACCAKLEERIAAARAGWDDRTTDEALEQLALACPERTKGLLGRLFDEDVKRCPEPLARIAAFLAEYEVRIAASDTILWAAVYFDRARPLRYVDSAARELVLEFHVRSGEGPSAGQLVKVRKTQPAGIVPGDHGDVLVRLVRQPGPEPFRLEAEISTKAEKIHVTACPSGEGTIGLGGLGWSVRTAEPPPFVPPREFRGAGVPDLIVRNCVTANGRTISHLSSFLHPRHVGAALDWLRRFEYAPGSPCDRQILTF
jgi:hypothetical protein